MYIYIHIYIYIRVYYILYIEYEYKHKQLSLRDRYLLEKLTLSKLAKNFTTAEEARKFGAFMSVTWPCPNPHETSSRPPTLLLKDTR